MVTELYKTFLVGHNSSPLYVCKYTYVKELRGALCEICNKMNAKMINKIIFIIKQDRRLVGQFYNVKKW